MKGHVAPENLNGGLNNQTSASIVFDRRPPSCLPPLWGHGTLQYSSPCRDGASGSAMTAVTLLQGAPLHLVTGPTRLPPPPPPLPPLRLPSMHSPFPHYRLGWMQECLVSPTVRKCRECSQPYGVCMCVCECVCHAFIEQLSQCVCVCVCVYCSRAQRDSLSQWRAPV